MLYYHKSKLLLPSKYPLFVYKLICIVQPGRPGCSNGYILRLPDLIFTILFPGYLHDCLSDFFEVVIRINLR